ncbi:MAG: hypothetical protein ACTMIK_10635, partial [Galactobacter sp.]
MFEEVPNRLHIREPHSRDTKLPRSIDFSWDVGRWDVLVGSAVTGAPLFGTLRFSVAGVVVV